MRGLSHLSTPRMALQQPSLLTRVNVQARKVQKFIRQTLCVTINGGHELYRARSDSKLFQQCLLCGYETPGWTIDRRDRRLHLVTKAGPAGSRPGHLRNRSNSVIRRLARKAQSLGESIEPPKEPVLRVTEHRSLAEALNMGDGIYRP